MIGDGTILRQIGAFARLREVFDGKKTLALQITAAVSLLWGLVSPGTAPAPGTLNDIGASSQTAITETQAWVEQGRVRVLPVVAGVVLQVLALFTHVGTQGKVLTALRVIGALAGRFVEARDLKEPDKILAAAKPVEGRVVEVGKGAAEIQAALKASPIGTAGP